MGLWLEHRDDKGKLLERTRFSGGKVTMTDMVEYVAGSPTDPLRFEPLVLTIDEARHLCRASAHLPTEKRDWVMRIGFEDED
jgi:hypothetical protein